VSVCSADTGIHEYTRNIKEAPLRDVHTTRHHWQTWIHSSSTVSISPYWHVHTRTLAPSLSRLYPRAFKKRFYSGLRSLVSPLTWSSRNGGSRRVWKKGDTWLFLMTSSANNILNQAPHDPLVNAGSEHQYCQHMSSAVRRTHRTAHQKGIGRLVVRWVSSGRPH
jgi:hypothetical protein